MFKIVSDNPNYLARLIRLPFVQPHPNADKLALVTVQAQNIIVSKDSKEGDLYVLFQLESKINSDFLSFINGYSDAAYNRDKLKKGFFLS